MALNASILASSASLSFVGTLAAEQLPAKLAFLDDVLLSRALEVASQAALQSPAQPAARGSRYPGGPRALPPEAVKAVRRPVAQRARCAAIFPLDEKCRRTRTYSWLYDVYHPLRCVSHPSDVYHPQQCVYHPQRCVSYPKMCAPPDMSITPNNVYRTPAMRITPQRYVYHPRGCVYHPKRCVLSTTM